MLARCVPCVKPDSAAVVEVAELIKSEDYIDKASSRPSLFSDVSTAVPEPSREDTYDPTRADYIVPASQQDVTSGELARLKKQLASLQSTLERRKSFKKNELQEEPEVLRHYEQVLGDTLAQIKAVESSTNIAEI
mmetsp:Transcript_70334/g.111185  ORF Transcript_70334/g.111185 Transcript_70334/m.111185 type:complete len:135 (-) Transcript_70334:116-520(-)